MENPAILQAKMLNQVQYDSYFESPLISGFYNVRKSFSIFTLSLMQSGRGRCKHYVCYAAAFVSSDAFSGAASSIT